MFTYRSAVSTQGTDAVTREIPDIVIGRLPIYLRELIRLAEDEGKINTSSHELGKRLGISSAQIRKDLSHFGEFGKQGTGYHINYLVTQLREILQLSQEWHVAVVGAGYLGHALAHYHGFEHRGFRISWIFDSDPEKIGQQMDQLVVLDVANLEKVIAENNVKVAIIVVPASHAQEITDRLVAVGVRSILSYAPIHLAVPAGVEISYSDPVIQLQRMTYYL
ncbi:MAG: redox-sensing transcriptional repressor Rex [Anaerolineales bacterium]|nr:redox-sensing transcriptional repressor Rex [Anaerolineales bacterium]MCB8939368.1 redox-sensing transcriptional repressor Rex [Ardenticatenaceae bacterium]